MERLVDNNDGTGLQHWEGSNDADYGSYPLGIDVGVSNEYLPESAYLSGKKNPPMPFLRSGYGEPAVNPNQTSTGYVPLPGENG